MKKQALHRQVWAIQVITKKGNALAWKDKDGALCFTLSRENSTPVPALYNTKKKAIDEIKLAEGTPTGSNKASKYFREVVPSEKAIPVKVSINFN